MPDGLLYLALVVVWAFVLIPMWLRRHDEANESRSVDRFARALSSLSGRRDRKGHESSGGMFVRARAVVMPGRPRGARDLQVTVSGASAPAEPTPAAAPGPRSEPPRAATAAARRRRQVLLGLLLVTGLVLAAGLLHKLPLWAVAVPAALVVAFLVSIRRRRKRAEQMRRRRVQRRSLTEVARAAEAGRTARRGRSAGSTASAAGPDVEFEGPYETEVTVTVPAGRTVEGVDDRGWAAVPTTLPTYVTAPAATRVPRVIDRSTPGSWSGAAMLEQARMTRQEEAREESGMRVESFEIRVPHPAGIGAAGPATDRPADDYAERYVDRNAGTAELEETDDESVLSALLDDPRTGAWPETGTYRQAAG